MFPLSFRAFTEVDWYGYAGADEGSEIAELTLSAEGAGFVFIAGPKVAEVSYCDEAGWSFAWQVDAANIDAAKTLLQAAACAIQGYARSFAIWEAFELSAVLALRGFQRIN